MSDPTPVDKPPFCQRTSESLKTPETLLKNEVREDEELPESIVLETAPVAPLVS